MTLNLVSLPARSAAAARRTLKRLRSTSYFRTPRIESLESRELLFAGELDLAFGSAGKVITEFHESVSYLESYGLLFGDPSEWPNPCRRGRSISPL